MSKNEDSLEIEGFFQHFEDKRRNTSFPLNTDKTFDRLPTENPNIKILSRQNQSDSEPLWRFLYGQRRGFEGQVGKRSIFHVF